jgi:hypothetical protein
MKMSMRIDGRKYWIPVPLVCLLCFGLISQALSQPGNAQVRQRGTGTQASTDGGKLPQIMVRLRDARANHSYVGTRQVTTGSGQNLRSYLERLTVSGAMVRTEFPGEGPFAGFIVIDTPKERLTYNPSQKEIRRSEPLPVEAMIGFLSFSRGQRGTIRTAPGGKVAGFQTTLFELVDPRGTVSQRAWVDLTQLVVLKREVLGPRGQKVMAFEFLQIDHGVEISERAFRLEIPGARFVTPREELLMLSRRTGLPAYGLPENSGFRLNFVRTIGRGDQLVVRQFYSGEAKVSLIVSRREIPARNLRDLADGRVKVYSWKIDGVSLALIGDLPEEELKLLAGRVQIWQPRRT